MSGLDDRPPAVGLGVSRHARSKSVRVMTVNARPNATRVATTAPITTANVLAAAAAQSLRQIGVRRCTRVRVGTSVTVMGDRPGDLRPARVNAAVALAGLRHPAATIAMMASPATQAEAVVSSDIDTQPGIVPTQSPPVQAPSPAHRWWAVPLVVLSFGVLLVVVVASVLPGSIAAENAQQEAASYALVPADAQPVADRLAFDAVDRYPADGELLFVTVREPQISLLDWFVGEPQPEVVLLSAKQKFGIQTPAQQRRINVEMMRSAKETAEYVALTTLGYPAEIVPGDVIVREMLCLEANDDGSACVRWAPSDQLLDPGDTLLEVDGVELETIDQLSAVLKKHQPGDTVRVEFERPGAGKQSGEVELIASGDGTNRTIIGFVPFDTASAELPFDVAIDSGAIGGPSAGLAFTLTLIDELTPGELTGGNRVAVTGTIAIDGSVGAIGGLVQKTSAVKQSGVKVFIVPFDQGADDIAAARAVAGDDLEVIPVKTVDEALAALARFGGNGLELGKPGESFTA
jgi:Lon-like protease